jgi:hypothetical protein
MVRFLNDLTCSLQEQNGSKGAIPLITLFFFFVFDLTFCRFLFIMPGRG